MGGSHLTMHIFLSFSSAQRELAERVALSLEGDGHDVFYDRSSLPAGDTYDARIREAIAGCDLFVFLLSPDAVEAGAYALTELRLAELRWRQPAQRVLPVMAVTTPMERVPAYLRSVSILHPQGDPVAEIGDAIARLRSLPRRRRLRMAAIAGFVAAVSVAAIGTALSRYREIEAARAAEQAHAEAARTAVDAGNFQQAWYEASEALGVAPRSEAAHRERRELAFAWLHAVPEGAEPKHVSDVLERVVPALERELAFVSGREAADVYAHLGWARALAPRDENGKRPDPGEPLAHALEIDPDNTYAHAMLGRLEYWRRDTRGGPFLHRDEARRHLEAAEASGRLRPFVRQMQLETWLATPVEPPELGQVLKLADAMRRHDEPLPSQFRQRLYGLFLFNAPYTWESHSSQDIGDVLAPDAALATYRWLTADGVDEHYASTHRFVLARLLERAGQRDEARSIYRDLSASASKWSNASYRSALASALARTE